MTSKTLKYNCFIQLPENNGLEKEWNYKTIYVNPPYGADRTRGTTIKNWLSKCTQSHKIYNSEIIALVPVATNTTHWKEFVFGEADAVCFLYDTRLRFLVKGSTENKGAPMACAMIYWGNRFSKFEEVFQEFGAVLNLENLKKTKGKPQESLLLFA